MVFQCVIVALFAIVAVASAGLVAPISYAAHYAAPYAVPYAAPLAYHAPAVVAAPAVASG